MLRLLEIRYILFKNYINLEIVFRDDKKGYYTMKELLIDYYKNNNAKYNNSII